MLRGRTGSGAGRTRKIGAESLRQKILLPALTLELAVVFVAVVAVATVGVEPRPQGERVHHHDPPSHNHLGVAACGAMVPHIPGGDDGTFQGDPSQEHAWDSPRKDIHGASHPP